MLQSRLLLKGWVDFQETVIDGCVILIKQHLDNAKAFINRLKQRPVAFLAFPQGGFGLFAITDIVDQCHKPLNASLSIKARHIGGTHVPGSTLSVRHLALKGDLLTSQDLLNIRANPFVGRFTQHLSDGLAIDFRCRMPKPCFIASAVEAVTLV